MMPVIQSRITIIPGTPRSQSRIGMRLLHIQMVRLQEHCSSMLLNERSDLPICSLVSPAEATVRVKILSVPPMAPPVIASQQRQ